MVSLRSIYWYIDILVCVYGFIGCILAICSVNRNSVIAMDKEDDKYNIVLSYFKTADQNTLCNNNFVRISKFFKLIFEVLLKQLLLEN